MRRRTSYLRALTWWCIALGAVAVAFNVLVDPYGYFRILTIAGINAKKPRPDIDMIAVKSAGLRAVHPDALILGNSRAEIGFDPEHPGFARRGLSAYNFSIPGGDLQTVWQQLRNDGAPLSPKLAIIGVDFQDFLVEPGSEYVDYPEPIPQGAWPAWRSRLQAAFTTTAIVDSFTTLLIQSRPDAATLTARGFNPLRDYAAIARIDGWHTLFQHKAEAVARSLVTMPKAIVPAPATSSPPLRLLRKLVRTSLEQGTDLHLVIYPYHSQLLMLYDAAGLWSAFTDWKPALAALVAQESERGAAKGRVVLWDFSGFNRYTLDPVPSRDNRAIQPRWYWESAHFRKELGDIVLDQILGGGEPATGFGAPLTMTSVNDQVVADNAGRIAFRTAHPEVAAAMERLLGRARQMAAKTASTATNAMKQ